MFTLPLYFALIPFAVVVGYVALMSFLNIVHIIHYGATTFVSFVVTFAFLVGAAGICFVTYNRLLDTDWRQPVELNLVPTGFSDFGKFNSPQP